MGINVSVTSVTMKLLEKKDYIKRSNFADNRKKNINLLQNGLNIFNKIQPIIKKEESQIFDKLNNETFNFTNSLKLLLGRKIRIKAKNIKNDKLRRT